MSGRKHDEAHKIEVLNSFADNENIFIEYAHSAILTGKITVGIKGTLKPGAARYCMTSSARNERLPEFYVVAWSFLLYRLAISLFFNALVFSPFSIISFRLRTFKQNLAVLNLP
jgi:hypothetical protein